MPSGEVARSGDPRHLRIPLLGQLAKPAQLLRALHALPGVAQVLQGSGGTDRYTHLPGACACGCKQRSTVDAHVSAVYAKLLAADQELGHLTVADSRGCALGSAHVIKTIY